MIYFPNWERFRAPESSKSLVVSVKSLTNFLVFFFPQGPLFIREFSGEKMFEI